MQSTGDPIHLHAEDPTAAAALHGSALARFRRGVALGFPIFLGYMPVGMAFGILSRGLGFTLFEACLCSATAIAGAGQDSEVASFLEHRPEARVGHGHLRKRARPSAFQDHAHVVPLGVQIERVHERMVLAAGIVGEDHEQMLSHGHPPGRESPGLSTE